MLRAGPLDLSSTFLRLRADASAEPLNVDETFWQRLTSGQLGDFHHERLVAGGNFEADVTHGVQTAEAYTEIADREGAGRVGHFALLPWRGPNKPLGLRIIMRISISE